jgi:glucokinase
MQDSVSIALDLGGTKIMTAAINSKREIIARERANTPVSLSEGLSVVKNLIRSVSSGLSIRAIGASAGGPLDYQTGIVSPLHQPEWREVPLREIIEDEFGVPFKVDVDTNAAALAEYHFGRHRSARLLYVTLSTGMGGGFIVDGKIYRGANGSHPEIAHQAIPYRLPVSGPIKCSCGATDCLEAIVCGTAIERIYGTRAEGLSPAQWDEVAYNLGQGLRNVATIYSPETILLGGGMALGGAERLIHGVRTVLENNLKIVPIPIVQLSTLGYDAALWGAYALAEEL